MTTNVVEVMLPSGIKTNIKLTLESKPIRQNQKLETLVKYVQKHPSGWKKRLELADLLYSMGEWEKAISEYEQVLNQQPKLIEIWLKLGKIFQLIGLTEQAIKAYEGALIICPYEVIKHHIMGLIDSCKNQHSMAIDSMRSATKLNPNHAAHWLSLGLSYLRIESPINALQAFDQVLKINPDDVTALNYNHDALLGIGNIQAAWNNLNRAFNIAPDDIGTIERIITHRLKQRLVKNEEGKQTWQLIRKAIQLAPCSVNIQALLVYYHIFTGKLAKATAISQQFIEEYWHNPLAWYYYARFMFHTGQFQTAVTAIFKAYQMYQKDWEIYRLLCEILPIVDKVDKLRDIVEEMLEYFPEHWSVWGTAGQVLVEHCQEIEAGISFSGKGIELQPQLADAWFYHGRVLALAGKHSEAIEILKQGWQWLPTKDVCLQSAPVAGWLAESSNAIGDEINYQYWWKIAANCADQMVNFDPTIAYYWQGRALAALGNKTQAKQAYQQALSQHLLYPADMEIKGILKSF